MLSATVFQRGEFVVCGFNYLTKAIKPTKMILYCATLTCGFGLVSLLFFFFFFEREYIVSPNASLFNQRQEAENQVKKKNTYRKNTASVRTTTKPSIIDLKNVSVFDKVGVLFFFWYT